MAESSRPRRLHGCACHGCLTVRLLSHPLLRSAATSLCVRPIPRRAPPGRHRTTLRLRWLVLWRPPWSTLRLPQRGFRHSLPRSPPRTLPPSLPRGHVVTLTEVVVVKPTRACEAVQERVLCTESARLRRAVVHGACGVPYGAHLHVTARCYSSKCHGCCAALLAHDILWICSSCPWDWAAFASTERSECCRCACPWDLRLCASGHGR